MKLPIHLYLAAATAALLSLPHGGYGFSASSHGPSHPKSNTASAASTKSPSSDAFIFRNFATECDDNNSPPSLKTILGNIQQLTSQGSDIRGRFVDHPRLGRISQAAKAISDNEGGVPALTPFVAFCLGHAFAKIVLEQQQKKNGDDVTTIALGRDPRQHGTILCDAFGRGAQSADKSIRVVYTGVATSPSMFHFCRYVQQYRSIYL